LDHCLEPVAGSDRGRNRRCIALVERFERIPSWRMHSPPTSPPKARGIVGEWAPTTWRRTILSEQNWCLHPEGTKWPAATHPAKSRISNRCRPASRATPLSSRRSRGRPTLPLHDAIAHLTAVARDSVLLELCGQLRRHDAGEIGSVHDPMRTTLCSGRLQ